MDYIACEECGHVDYDVFIVKGLCQRCLRERQQEWPDTLAAINREEHARQ